MASLTRTLWKAAFRRWRTPLGNPRPGYTLLLPVPGDLPVFAEIALAVCRKLDPAHRLATFLIPDVFTPPMQAIVDRERPTWPGGGLDLVRMRRPDRWLPGLLKRPHANHWLQLVNGSERAATTHALLHDADLFIADAGFHRGQFERIGDRSCLGVHPAWDKWYESKGLKVAATWELLFRLDWLRRFPPHEHLGHDADLLGERHTFDTTLLPQAKTPPGEIDWHAPGGGLVHFNYVICTYRYFQASKTTYEDDHFRILLVRLLVDLFDKTGWPYEVPAADRLADGLTDQAARVTYLGPETAGRYREFRAKLEELLATDLLTADQRATARRIVAPFDAKFGRNHVLTSAGSVPVPSPPLGGEG